MADIFLKIVNMSISASWIVLAVLLLRLLLKKAPKWINGILWGIVGLRLIMPFSFESVFSLIPSGETISKAPDAPRPHFESGVTIIDNQVNDYLGGHYYEGVTRPTGHFADITTILAIVWIVGIVVFLAYTIISYLRVKNKIGTAVLLRDNIYQSENVVSPFVLGIIKPKIYLPFNMNEQDMAHVIAHENAHIRRKDHLWKPFGFLVLTLHWFNPLMWLGYVLLCRDIELACDEKVVKEFDNEQKADYSQALLTCSVNRRIIAACPLAFGEIGVKDRVKSVLNYKKPAFWIIVVAIITSIAVAVCFLTNPKKETDFGISSSKNGSDLNGISIEIVNADLSAPDPFFDIKWTNKTSEKITFGEQFAVFCYQDGQWENCSIEEDPVWNLIAYLLDTKSTVEHTYKLNGQIMTQTGKYRFEAPFTIDGKSETKYKAWIEFELNEGVDGITVHTFKPIELIYDDGMYSFVQTVESAPTYMIVNGIQLVEKTDDSVSEPIGTFEEITLNKDNFDSRFRSQIDYSWLAKDTLKSLKDNNKRIWQLHSVFSTETPHLYILLEQKDGTFYLGFGYYNCNSINPANPDDSHIRWLYKLEDVSESNIGGADSSNVQTFESTVSYANWSDDSKIYVQALNTDKMSINSVQHLPIYKFDTLKDLEQFKNTFGSLFTMDSGYDEVPSFNSVTKKYDNAFFEENSLLLVYVSAGNCTHRFKMQNVGYDDKSFSVHVVETTNAEYVDTAMAGWFITVAVSDNLIKTVTSFDADLNNAVDISLPKYEGDKVIDVPPTLVVVSNGQSIEALKGTSSWIHEGTNGMSEAVMSDSGHPLMMKKSMPSIDILPVHYATIGDPLQAKIQFNAKGVTPVYEVPPDEIYIRCWEEKHWGKTNAKSENINPTIINGNLFFDLKDGNYIYEVVATWSTQDKFSGTAQYSFYTLKSDANSNMD